ncbi:MAG: glycosyltransferase family 9 protein [Cyclobacteriaceae bacterium]|nr:glycosyltransferase family 9 protein [Cyclobacteriaceae bacterium]
MPSPKSFLLIQTAFIGDVILATSIIEKLHSAHPDAAIDFLLRKGNETLLTQHPHLRNVLIWDKKKGKIKNLLTLISKVRSLKYDVVINVHRFASSGLITTFSGARLKIGFEKNPWSFAFSLKVKHELDSGLHEIDRNQKLIDSLTDGIRTLPRLYPSPNDFEAIRKFQSEKYLCLAPTSVWFTKQFPTNQWIDFIKTVPHQFDPIYLLGAPSDKLICDRIVSEVGNARIINLAGKLSFLESAALMKGAMMNFVNDSAPMHLGSAMNAPVTAIYCSTVPSFGFGPLSDKSFIVQTKEKLSCRPCGLHGHKACPEGHFKCATTIASSSLQNSLDT